MQRHKKDFWAAVKRAATAHGERADLRKASPLLSPWSFWLLIGLVRHRKRQRWVADVIRNHLHGDPSRLAVAGAFGQPAEARAQGVVPGMPDWEFCFHGIGCELTHRITGESIDVDFHDAEGEWFDGWFYCRYLGRARQLTPAEQRLIELHPSVDSIMFSLEELELTRLVIGRRENRAVFKLADDVVANTALVEAFCDAWSRGENRFAAAIEVGDWLAAIDCLPEAIDEPTARLLQGAAEATRRVRAETVMRHLEEGHGDRAAIFALSEAAPPDFDAVIEQVLQGPPSGLVVSAIDVIAGRGDAAWCDRVFALFKRLDPNTEIPEPAAWMRSAQFLLKHAYRVPEVLTALSRAHSHEAAEAALLLLEHAPALSRPRFRAALRSYIPCERRRTAAILAILDEDWAIREMIEALWASEDQQMTADCRAALCCSHSPEARRAVEEWEKRFPHVPPSGPPFRISDLLLKDADSFLQYEMSQLHDRVLPLRGRVA